MMLRLLLLLPLVACQSLGHEATTDHPDSSMRVQYLEIVTTDVDALCATYAASLGAEFGEPEPMLGNARMAPMPDGTLLGVRAPLADHDLPIVRPYWLVDDIEAAQAKAVEGGGVVAHPPMELPGHGTFAIYIQGDVHHGLWQLPAE